MPGTLFFSLIQSFYVMSLLSFFTQSANHTSKRFYSTPAYFVSRTINKGLPVYSEYKNGGTRLLTVVRRIEGDANALIKDINADFPEAVVSLNTKTQHVVIKGHHVNEVKEWLINKGF
ncbi:mitochondrial large subunit ribosomal protein-domain-containing protein [Parasitella parasitica]|nr:mitochondrial large subunit ribosomal protein-domain-containing protein [Parasitella parasitica]